MPGSQPNLPESIPDILIITHAMLSGAAILIPIPFVDDFIVSIVRQNLVRVLAKYNGVEISPEEVRLLSGLDSGDGCWPGLLNVLKYPFKIVRQLIRVLEVKKSLETATHTYYTGILLNEVMQNGWYQRERFGMIHQAIHYIKKNANKDLVMEIFRSYLVLNKENFIILTTWGRETFSYLFEATRSQARGLWRRIRLLRTKVEENPETLFERQPPQITKLARQIYENLDSNLLGKPQAQKKEMFELLAIALRPEETVENAPLTPPNDVLRLRGW